MLLSSNSERRLSVAACVLAAIVTSACGPSPQTTPADAAQLAFTSSRYVKVRGTLMADVELTTTGRVSLSDPATRARALSEIDFQLKFAIGQSRFRDAAFKHRPPELLSIAPVASAPGTSGTMVRVSYRTEVTSTAAKGSPGLDMRLVLPARTDVATLQAIADSFTACTEKTRAELIATYGEASWHAMAFYYFQPDRPGCPLQTPGFSSPLLVYRSLHLAPSSDNDDFKRPNYAALWADKHFKGVLIFTPTKDLIDADEGVAAYTAMVQWLVGGYASYIVSNDLAGAAAGASRPSTHLVLDFHNGLTADFTLMVMPTTWKDGGPSGQYREQVAAATADADYVSYNGHADYGHNVQTLEDWATVAPRHYQIFYLNGCSTYSYLEDELFDKHALANPGQSRDAYLDVLANANQGFFRYNALQNELVISALMQQRASWLEMFATVDASVPAEFNPGMVLTGSELF